MISNLAKTAGKFVQDNSPALLAALGIAGTVTTAVLSAQAGYRACEILAEDERERNFHPNPIPIEPREKVRLVLPVYIPAIATGVASCGLIIASVYVSNRRVAALAAAYSLSEKALDEYKKKVVEQIGANKERKVRDAIAQDRMEQETVEAQQVYATGGGNVLCYDMYTGRYFYSDMESLKQAENRVNHMIVNNNYASLSDLYDQLCLPRTGYSDEVGWNLDKLLEMQITTTLADDNRPCLAIHFRVEPIRGYHRVY